uniref:Golgi apparatus membrane protein TVP23 n=1 Tax=Populus trichocarpa TaxID=3694 RepID=A0A3N7G3V5_POPTR
MRQGESVWKFECLDQQSSARMNKKDSWLFWWTLYLNAAAWVILGIFSVIRFEADYVLVVSCLCKPQHSKHCWIHQVPQRCQEANSRICMPGYCVSFPYGLHLVRCKLSEQKFSRYVTFFCYGQ